MSVNISRDRQIMPSGYGMQAGGAPPVGSAPPVGASAPPAGAYGSQPGYGATYPQKPALGAQTPYNATTAYGQPNMNQPQYGAPPPQAPYASIPPQQPYSAQPTYPGAYQQVGGAPAPPTYPGAYQQAGGAPAPPTYPGAYQQAGGAPMGSQAGGAPMGFQAGGTPMGFQPGGPTMGMGMGMGGQGGVVSLVKGGNMSLSKAVPNLRHITVGLGWDVRQTPGAPFDLDASVFMLKGDGRVRMPQDLIFYNNRQSLDGSVYHHGDNLTGQGEGDDEQISVDLTRVPPEIQKIVCVVSIYEAEARMQNFGMVNRAFIRVVNADNTMEIVRFDLTEEASMFNCMVFGELYRYNNEWKFRAIGQGVPGGLRACGPMFGIAMQ